MPCYIDNARIPYRGMRMSHAMADTSQELRALAQAVGVDARHIQYPGTPREHLDLCAAKRVRALNAGARAVSSRDLVRLTHHKKGDKPHPFATPPL